MTLRQVHRPDRRRRNPSLPEPQNPNDRLFLQETCQLQILHKACRHPNTSLQKPQLENPNQSKCHGKSQAELNVSFQGSLKGHVSVAGLLEADSADAGGAETAAGTLEREGESI